MRFKKPFVLSILLLIIYVLSLSTANNKQYVTIGDHVYYIEDTQRVDVSTASHICTSLNMSLLSLQTEDKNQLIREYLTYNGLAGNLYWTCGALVDSQWTWTDSKLQFTYYDWYILNQEPNEDPNLADVCVMLGGRSGWWDEPCDQHWRFICQ